MPKYLPITDLIQQKLNDQNLTLNELAKQIDIDVKLLNRALKPNNNQMFDKSKHLNLAQCEKIEEKLNLKIPLYPLFKLDNIFTKMFDESFSYKNAQTAEKKLWASVFNLTSLCVENFYIDSISELIVFSLNEEEPTSKIFEKLGFAHWFKIFLEKVKKNNK